ncbi:MAG: DUF1730 domain-containing protein [Clostridia bacterium]|nr:DUF1730 domain-containing protein [Clostridia bacterium]
MYSKLLSDFFASENIEFYSCLDVSECPMLLPRKLPDFTRSVCFFLIPYFVRDGLERNISLYAVPRDYHLYAKRLEERLLDRLADTGLSARVFADNSPFDERRCAVLCGLGDVGRNGLLINPVYGSYVFIGSICLSCSISITQSTENFKCDLCGNCEKCRVACPFLSGRCGECLSGITQKKKIDEKEQALISSARLKWGCDICQEVCPYNKDISETPIEFFKEHRIPYVTEKILSDMSDEEFSKRAYAWRTRSVIERNLGL